MTPVIIDSRPTRSSGDFDMATLATTDATFVTDVLQAD
jgi:hypothetical protein